MPHPITPPVMALDDQDRLLDIQGLIEKLEYRVSENRLFEHISSVRSHWRERLF